MDNIKIRDRGLLQYYNPMGMHKDVIYFATDVQQLLLNGSIYGGGISPIIVNAVNVNDDSIETGQLHFDLTSEDYNKAIGASETDELIITFEDPVTEHNFTHLRCRYLSLNELVDGEFEKIWVIDSQYLTNIQKQAILTIFPTFMNCRIDFDSSEAFHNLEDLQRQINSEATEILANWAAKEGSNYTSDSKDITTAIYDLDLALKKEETDRIDSDKALTDKYDKLLELVNDIKEPHVLKVSNIPYTFVDEQKVEELKEAYNKSCPIFVEYTKNDSTISFRADTFITNNGKLTSFKASVVNTPTSRAADKITPDNDFSNEIYAVKVDLDSNIIITQELTRLNEVKNKVDKVEDHQLSEEDFTHVYREKLDDLIEGLLLIDLSDTENAKTKLNEALGKLTSGESNAVQKFNRWNYIFNSKYETATKADPTASDKWPETKTPERCEYKVTSLEYLGGNWVVAGASTTHLKGNKFFSKFSYLQSSNTLTVSFHEITPTSIGLDQVDNTADIDKPVSTATKNKIEKDVNDLSLEWVSGNTHLLKLMRKKYADEPDSVADANGNVTISYVDASDFVKMGMIDKVEIIDRGVNSTTGVKDSYLVITFKTDADHPDKTNTVELPISKLVNIYEGENAITIDDNNRLIKLVIDLNKNDNSYLNNGSTGLWFNDEFIINKITTETNARIAQDDKIEAAVGLNADGTHKTTTGNYTKNATTIAGEIAALDSQLKTTNDNFAARRSFKTVTGDSGTATADAAEDTLKIVGGTNITTVATDTDNNDVLTINHDAINRTDTNTTNVATVTIPATGTAIKINDAVTAVTTNAQGHVTGVTKNNLTVQHGGAAATATSTTAAPAFGGTITSVKSVTTDARGHVTNVTTDTVTIPSSEATTTANGLMPKDDKVVMSNLNKLQSVSHINDDNDNFTTDATTASFSYECVSTNDNMTSVTTLVSKHTKTIPAATTEKAGVMTAADKVKLNGVATGAEANQNAFSNVKVGTTTIAADSKTDTLEIVAGSNVTLTPDSTNDKLTIASKSWTTEIADAKSAGTNAQNAIDTHANRKDNPHSVTKSQVGLGNVTNDAQVKRTEMGAASGVATLDANSKLVQNIDASKITSGTISIDRLPKGALERLTIVADDTARKALTTATVQNGDTVKVTATGLMYYVKDETKLNQDAGWEVYTAASATSVPWSGVTGKPTTLSGYGITDAKISGGTITLGTNSITPITSHQSLADYAYARNGVDIGGEARACTTAEFIDKLKELGAFSRKEWSIKTGWTFSKNWIITDTGCGDIQLAGVVIKTYVQDEGHFFIEVITSPTAQSTAANTSPVPNTVFIYRNNGTSYSPGWTRLSNYGHTHDQLSVLHQGQLPADSTNFNTYITNYCKGVSVLQNADNGVGSVLSTDTVVNFGNQNYRFFRFLSSRDGQLRYQTSTSDGTNFGNVYTVLHSGNTRISNGSITINGTTITPLTSSSTSGLLTSVARTGDLNNKISVTVGGTTKTAELNAWGSSYGTKLLTKTDNGGKPSLFLIADITEWKGKTSNAKQFGFSGRVISRRTTGYIRDYITNVFCRVGYADENDSRSVRLSTSNGTLVLPRIVSYNSKYYLALKVYGSSHNFMLEGPFVNCLSSFTELLYGEGDALPTGVTDLTSNYPCYTYDVGYVTDYARSLINTRTIWGQNFNGTANVSGDIKGAGYVESTLGITSRPTDINTSVGSNAYWYGLSLKPANSNIVTLGGYYGLRMFTREGTLMIGETGNVGIGTASPTFKLDVSGEIRSASANAFRATYGSYGFIIRNDGTNCYFLLTDKNAAVNGWNNFRPFTVNCETGVVNIGNNQITVAANNNVGIGIASPTDKLHVNGGATFNGPINIAQGSNSNHITALNSNLAAGSYSQFCVGKASTNYNRANFTYYHVGDGSSSNYIGLGLYGSDKLLNILGNGNVGIGTTTPTQKLEVNGNVKATSFIRTNGTSSQFLKADGSVDSNTYVTSSTLSNYATTSSLSNYVTLDTIQTVKGSKIFDSFVGIRSGLTLSNDGNNGISIYPNVEGIQFTDAANREVGTLNTGGTLTMKSFKKDGGTSSQFLKADGSVDSNRYVTAVDVANNGFLVNVYPAVENGKCNLSINKQGYNAALGSIINGISSVEIPVATTTSNGVLSAADKRKIDAVGDAVEIGKYTKTTASTSAELQELAQKGWYNMLVSSLTVTIPNQTAFEFYAYIVGTASLKAKTSSGTESSIPLSTGINKIMIGAWGNRIFSNVITFK